MPLHGFTYRLRWSDVRKVKESPDGSHDARVATTINYNIKVAVERSGNWRVTSADVTLRLQRPSMWVVKGKESAALLSHEQGHYDIAALAARAVYNRLARLSGDSLQDPLATAASLARDIMGEQAADGSVIVSGRAQQIQDLYDEGLVCGSNHGANPIQQDAWKHRIRDARHNGTLDDLLLICPGDFPMPGQTAG